MANHPPTGVLESIAQAVFDKDECEALKNEYNIVTRRHSSGANTSGNRRPGDKGKESHHILQDKAMEGLIGKRSGWAVLLDAAPGGEHDIANTSQIARNCPAGSGGGQGPKTFGELQKAAKEDLVKALQGIGKNAEKLANCLVVEAVKETEKKRRRRPNKKHSLKESSRVKPVKGCFAYGTLIWLNDMLRDTVENIKEGSRITTDLGEEIVVRCDYCMSDLVILSFKGSHKIALAPSHRVRLANGQYLRANVLRIGHQLESEYGHLSVSGIQRTHSIHNVYNIGVGHSASCKIGEAGLRVELSDIGTSIISNANITPYFS